MTDLSKTFGFDKMSLKLVHSYLSNCKQTVKINDSYSSWETLYAVPQGSILGPLLLNIFICDIYYFLEHYEIANYVNDTTPYSTQRNHQFVIKELEKSSAILFKWLGNNFMKVNTDKSHLLLSKNTKLASNINNNTIESEIKQQLLGITIDSNLSFQKHVIDICKKTSQNLNAWARLSSYMDIQEWRAIMKSFITS